MAGRQLRFVHASDLHLEQPLHGVTEVPVHLRDLFLDAAFGAAERVFDTVIKEQADFLLLSGDVLRMRAGGSRAMEFLWRQFHRLLDQEIPIYWCDSGADRIESWPTTAPLPPNVHWFASEHVERLSHRRLTHRRSNGDESERDLDRDIVIYGMGAAPKHLDEWKEFQHKGSAYAIAMVHVEQDVDSDWLDPSIGYWALGGLHQRQNVGQENRAHFCGSPQGRRPSEEGPHGCAVVDVDHRGVTRRHTVTTDIVRWVREKIELPDHVDSQGLLRLMRDRAHAIAEAAAGRQALVQWVLSDGDQWTDTRSDFLAGRLRQGALSGELLETMRNEFGRDVPGIWSLSLEAEPPNVLPSGWYDEDTVLGDLLRLVQHYQEDEAADLAMDPLAATRLNQRLVDDLVRIHPSQRERLLRQVAVLGVDLLRGDRILSGNVPS
jgi:exonuclease SbcD